MYIATIDPNGLESCVARYAAPSSGSFSSGVLIVALAIFDASGHAGAASFCKPISSVVHACKPSAAAGFKATPSGNVTDSPLTEDSAKPVGFRLVSCGTCSSTVSPVGVLPACPSGVTFTLGVNGNWLHPSNPTGRSRLSLNVYSDGGVKTPSSVHESPSTEVCTGPVHAVGNVNNGGGVSWPEGAHGGFPSSGSRQFQPRAAS